MKPMLEIPVNDLGGHVAFYKALLGADPVVRGATFMQFDSVDPPLSLRVTARETPAVRPAGNTGHFGIQLKTDAALQAYRTRFEELGVEAEISQDDVECCGTVQNKLWVEDDEGNGWELFVVTDQAEDGGCGDEVESCKNCPCNFT